MKLKKESLIINYKFLKNYQTVLRGIKFLDSELIKKELEQLDNFLILLQVTDIDILKD